MVYTIDALIQKIMSGDRQYDLGKIVAAYDFAKDAHKDQVRYSGEPYIIHPLAVSYILLELGMDTDSICAALLHDVVEDTGHTLDEIKKNFGGDVATLVDGLTKLEKVPLSTKEEQQAENVRKILLAMSADIRVIIIKLADRLHNMRTLKYMPEHKRRNIARETMDIFAPIAHRLGIRAVKEELEDLAFHYLDPYACDEIERMLDNRKEEREAFIESIKSRIADRLKDMTPPPVIEGRVKSLYGIYKKVYIVGKSFDEVYDIYAVRVIVSSIAECYNVLGIIHDMFKPIPNRFKDYISTPKANMYQSLHTTVIGREGIPFEVQIRTTEMHHTAELGIAAHWKYKAGIQGKDKLEERLAWVRQLIEAQQTSEEATDLVSSIKTDIAPEEVFAFTPKGDVFALPVGATIVDFAYAIHSEVGNKMNGAKVDGRIAPLDHRIKTGEIVEILTTNAQNHGPSRAWLSIAKTSEAKSKIRLWFKRERREENIEEGKAVIERELKRNGIIADEKTKEKLLLDATKRKNFDNIDDLYAAVGYGGLIITNYMQRLKEEYGKIAKTSRDIQLVAEQKQNGHKGKIHSGIIVDELDNCLIKLSQCCNPLPGDDIVGFITRGHGVSIHKTDCVNVIAGKQNPENAGRWVEAHWHKEKGQSYRTTLEISAYNRDGLFSDVASVLAGLRIPVHEISARELKDGNATVVATIDVTGLDQLEFVIKKIEAVKDVVKITRTGKN
ncbi:MAG: RelA/SpoT family protein [Oscillospiraceae bacterium]